MVLWVLSSLLIVSTVWGQSEIVEISKGNDAYLVRENVRDKVKAKTLLKEKDVLYSESANILIKVLPTVQLSMDKNTRVRFGKERIELMKGIVRVKVDKDEFKVATEGAVFTSHKGVFEILIDNNQDSFVSVESGLVEVSSPYIQSFVPEYVKANEGLKFSKKNRKFERQGKKILFKTHPKFLK